MAYARAFEATGVCHTPLRRTARLGLVDNSRALRCGAIEPALSEAPAPVELREGVLKRVQVVVEHGTGDIEVVYGRVQRQRLQS